MNGVLLWHPPPGQPLTYPKITFAGFTYESKCALKGDASLIHANRSFPLSLDYHMCLCGAKGYCKVQVTILNKVISLLASTMNIMWFDSNSQQLHSQ